MVKAKRGWDNPAKQLDPTTEGSCPYCHEKVNGLEDHIHDMHKGAKPAKKKISL